MHNHLIEEQLQKKILIIDGAMGTMLQGERDLTADDFWWRRIKKAVMRISYLTRPRMFYPTDSSSVFRSWC